MLEMLSAVNPGVAESLARQLEQVTIVFERQLASDLSSVNTLCRHIEQYRGKMLRPSLVILTGLAAGSPPDKEDSISEAHRTVAAVVEMIHMATLVHDDVLDDAVVRRNGATVNHLRGNEAAVMLGDYLISNAFHLCSSIGDPAINLALGEVTNTLCEGELLQLHHRDDYSIDEQTYFEIIRRKTASLIASCCRLGAQLSGAQPTVSEAAARFGAALGIAFQIQDDLLDLVGDETTVGKTLGRDLDKGKLTLPILHFMSTASQAARGDALKAVESHDLQTLLGMITDCGAINYTRAVAADYVAEAQSELAEFPQSKSRDLLQFVTDQVVQRSR